MEANKEEKEEKVKYDDIVKMYEDMPPIEPLPMNTESISYFPPLGLFDDVDGLG